MLAGITLVLALVGGLIPIFSAMNNNRVLLHRATGIAAGILLASALLVVIPEGFELAMGEHDEGAHEEEEGLEGLFIGGAILSGFMLMLLLEGSGIGHAIHEEHHHHDDEHGHSHVHHQTAPFLLLFGLSAHAAADGLAIGSAAAATSVAVTFMVAFAVIVHKMPAAFSLGIFAMHQYEQRSKAIRDVVLFSLATPIMIIISAYFFQGLATETIGLVLLFAGGTFLYVATVDTLPDIHNPETGTRAMIDVFIGALILSVILVLAITSGLIEHGH
jgi:zinc transporter 9